jgi:O-antigen biosynthesis protein WbqP
MDIIRFLWGKISQRFFQTVPTRLSLLKEEDLKKRWVDFFLGSVALIVFSVPLLIVGLLVKLTSKGPALYWSDRVGRNNVVFSMPKLRTMRTGTEVVATHLLPNPERCLTPIGGILRKSSFDELPQLWCIIRGDMSVVGPRPALFNQDNLIKLRTEKGVHALRPGLTGWAQINGRDELPIPEKVELDAYYLRHRSLALDIRVIFLTCLKVINRDGISH